MMGNNQMQRLVDQAERIDVARADRALRRTVLVQAVGKVPRRPEVGEDDIAGSGEQARVQSTGFPHPARNVELTRRTAP